MESILDKLKNERVVSFEITEDETEVNVQERCDQCFGINLSKSELTLLSAELLNLANKMK